MFIWRNRNLVVFGTNRTDEHYRIGGVDCSTFGPGKPGNKSSRGHGIVWDAAL